MLGEEVESPEIGCGGFDSFCVKGRKVVVS